MAVLGFNLGSDMDTVSKERTRLDIYLDWEAKARVNERQVLLVEGLFASRGRPSRPSGPGSFGLG